ncbi:MAG: hypothetical protein KF832_00780 [Caldilineaceae bacterium]|nr:hypothetical protein [Caldilineaceae bacterium]
MQVPDFGRSFLTFRIDLLKQPAITVSAKPPFTLNNARIQIEARCLITDRQTNVTTAYVLGAACKSEQVGVTADIWHEPNADFCCILSAETFLTLKSWDKNDKGVHFYPPSRGVQPERQWGKVAEAFDRTKINVALVEGEVLPATAAIVQATLADELLVGQIEFTEADRYDVLLEFPIKTMNASERDNLYQTDTGPILFPDFSGPFDEILETFQLAYVAYNAPDWAEFILRVPTPLTDTISVNHYSKTVHLPTHNRVIRLAV